MTWGWWAATLYESVSSHRGNAWTWALASSVVPAISQGCVGSSGAHPSDGKIAKWLRSLLIHEDE